MKRITLLFLILTITASLFAIPAKKGVIERVQPDGSTISFLLFGDEGFHYTTTEDSYLLCEDAEGYLCYAQRIDNKTVSTGVRAVDISKRPAEHRKLLAQMKKFELTDEQLIECRIQGAQQRLAAAIENTTAAQAPKGICILVNFSDVTFKHTREEFDNMLNQRGYNVNGATGSGTDYFYATSGGRYTPTFDVFGPVTLDRPESYYGQNDNSGSDLHPDQMVVDALTKLSQDPEYTVNFADYDADNDGYIDNVFIYYAGYAESNGAPKETIWPHRWAVSKYNVTGSVTFGSKTVRDYACGSELTSTRGTKMSAVGTFCHEFSHVLGLPDMYATDGSTIKTLGSWDIMDYGCYNNECKTPCLYSAYEKFYCGWTTPTLLNEPVNAVLYEFQSSEQSFIVTSTGRHNLRATSPNPTTFVMLENRQQSGWDQYLPYHGLLATKIEYSATAWYANTVNTSNKMRVDILEAYTASSWGSSSNGNGYDVYPGSRRVTSLTPFTNYPITEITETSETTKYGKQNVIRFRFMGGVDECYTVQFATRGLGSCVNKLTETAVGSGITLPDVITTDEGYTFVGWSTKNNCSDANIGVAGELYYPTRDIHLYAVYQTEEGIVEANYNCIDESGKLFVEAETEDVSSILDAYTSKKGWSGENIFCKNGLIKIGENSYLKTPELLLHNDLIITFSASAENEETTLDVSTESKSHSANSITLTTEPTLYTLEFNDVEGADKVLFEVEGGAAYINDISICGTIYKKPVGVENGRVNDLLIYRVDKHTSALVGGEVGAPVECYDALGRKLWSDKIDKEPYEFSHPHGFYILRVGDKIVKGL